MGSNKDEWYLFPSRNVFVPALGNSVSSGRTISKTCWICQEFF